MESHAIPPFPLPRRTFGSSHARHRHRRTRRRGQPRHAARLSRHATVRPAHRAHAVGDTPPDRRRSVDDERAGASQGSEPADAIASYWRSAWTGCATYSAPTPDALATHATDCHRLALSGPGPQSKRRCGSSAAAAPSLFYKHHLPNMMGLATLSWCSAFTTLKAVSNPTGSRWSAALLVPSRSAPTSGPRPP